MALVTFRLTDFGFETMQGLIPEVRFHPRFNIGSAGTSGARLMPSKPIKADLVGAEGSVNLVPTDDVVPEAWYEVEIVYFGEAGGPPVRHDYYGRRVFVPAQGGALGDLPGAAPAPGSVLVQLAPPPPGYKGWYLNAPGPGEPVGDPNDPSSSGTGILEIVS